MAVNEEFTHLINTSITQGVFPTDWKKASVIPIPKAGDQSEVGNYRPISLVPAPGKVLEKIICEQLSGYLDDESLLTDSQYGFRKSRSTTLAVTQFLNHVNLALNRKNPTIALFIDFKKAFDCLQYPQLFQKLGKLNLNQTVINWIKDYLTDRRVIPCQFNQALPHFLLDFLYMLTICAKISLGNIFQVIASKV